MSAGERTSWPEDPADYMGDYINFILSFLLTFFGTRGVLLNPMTSERTPKAGRHYTVSL
jgi:hypothetical protein